MMNTYFMQTACLRHQYLRGLAVGYHTIFVEEEQAVWIVCARLCEHVGHDARIGGVVFKPRPVFLLVVHVPVHNPESNRMSRCKESLDFI